jgi:NAD(P)-dependent dehydrogenase (short-subunit alcohol dehydrogenase family)
MPGRLEGKVALITGGTSGIGRAGATRFCREGASVVVGALDDGRADEVLTSLQEEGSGDAFFVPTDVRNPLDVERLVESAVSRFGRLDVVYSNAGYMETGTATETSDEVWRQMIEVNLTGQFNVARQALPALTEGGNGSLIFTASDLGLVGAREIVAYCAAKGGVVNMTRAIAVDSTPHGVRVNCLCPGPVDTPMIQRWFEEAEDPDALKATQLEPVLTGRFADPDEIASAALFLASDDSSFMTGATLVVDGGVTCWYGL